MRIRLFGQYVHPSMAVLASAEAQISFGALMLAYRVRFGTWYPTAEASAKSALWPCAAVFSGALLVSFVAFGLYTVHQRAGTGGLLVRLLAGTANATVVTAALFYSFPGLWLGRGVLGLAALFALLGTVVSRLAFARVVDERALKRRVLVYGVGRRTAAVSRLQRHADPRGFRIVGFVQPEGESIEVPPECVLSDAGGLRKLCEVHRIDQIVVAMQDRRRAFPAVALLECRLAGIDVTDLLTFLERETGRVCVDGLHPSWMIFGDGFRRDPVRLFSSRALDLLASSSLLVMLLPLMVLTGVAIKLEDHDWRAPIFYRQPRVGLDGRTFDVLKFRSMRTDAEKDGQARWAQLRDPRVTRVGAVIRRTRIDELPQIVNVIRGQMSFVGPRPERPTFVRELACKIPYYGQRHCVKPGITGWAQLCYPYGASEQDAQEKLQYDLYYIKHNSLVFDLAILLQTAEVVLMGKGAR